MLGGGLEDVRQVSPPTFEARHGCAGFTSVSVVASLMTHGLFWSERSYQHGRDTFTSEFKPHPLTFAERYIDPETGKVTVLFIVGGDPGELYEQSILFARGAIWHPRDVYRKNHMELLAKVKEAALEGKRKHEAKQRGGAAIETP